MKVASLHKFYRNKRTGVVHNYYCGIVGLVVANHPERLRAVRRLDGIDERKLCSNCFGYAGPFYREAR